MVSVISTIHVIDFFKLSNPTWLAISLAIAFEVGAAASLASLIAMEKMNKSLVWFLFILLTAMQAMGNTYYAFVNLGDYTSWSELFGLIEEEEIFQKRVLSIVSGAILPIVALGFIKSLVDYIKPEENEVSNSKEHETTEIDSQDEDSHESELQDISEPLIYDSHLSLINLQGETLQSVDAAESDKVEEDKEAEKKPIVQDNVEVVNVNSNKETATRKRTPSVKTPDDPNLNPTKL